MPISSLIRSPKLIGSALLVVAKREEPRLDPREREREAGGWLGERERETSRVGESEKLKEREQ